MNAFLQLFQQLPFTTLFLDVSLKSVLVLVLVWVLTFLCRRSAAATRHWFWFAGLASLPLLLLFCTLPHHWKTPLWSLTSNSRPGNQVELTLELVRDSAKAAPPTAEPDNQDREAAKPNGLISPIQARPATMVFNSCWLAIGFGLWAVGALTTFCFLVRGWVHVYQLGRKATAVTGSRWQSVFAEAAEALHLRREVRLLQSKENVMPLTWGWRRPAVLLPAEAAAWPAERLRLVLLHELAHVKRRDCLSQTIVQLVMAVYWINPLVWLAVQRMSVERELACDDLVLNGGCKASTYASELLEIARAFRPMAAAAAIGMARSSQLQWRIAAIVDTSKVRRLRPLTVFLASLGIALAVFLFGGSSPAASGDDAESSALRRQQLEQLRAFSRQKEKQSEELAAKAGATITPEFQRYFEAAIAGDWQTVTNRYEYFKQHHPQYEHGDQPQLRTAYWSPVLEIALAYDHVMTCEPKYTQLFVDDLMHSVPGGSILFGGTDPGRGLPTAFSDSHVEGKPFFTLTQNALADGTYLEYLRQMYGDRLYIPTADDSQRCFSNYLNDAGARLEHDQKFPNEPRQLRPGEDVKRVNGKIQVAGQVSVMAINGLLTKLIFERNPAKQFFVEESFPLDWMYPHLEPHGTIMKINRQPLSQLPEQDLVADHDFWSKIVARALGDWLQADTPVSAVAEFADRIYVQHDLSGFNGDPRFVRNEYAQKLFSKLRSSIGGLYAWRINGNAPDEYRPKSTIEQQRLAGEADFAFKQSFALCPYSPEAVFRYCTLLVQNHRTGDALLVARTASKINPGNGQVKDLAGYLEKMQRK